MINPDLNIKAIKKEVTVNGIVEISDFLTIDFAEAMFKFLNFEMPDDWWTLCFRFSDSEKTQYLRNSIENKQLIQQYSKKALSIIYKREFGYFFYRTLGNHIKDCTCKECVFRQFLANPETISFLSKLIGVSLSQCGEIFCSWYKGGNFLASHSDKQKGKIGFIFNLSKNWSPEFGGNLHFLNDDWHNIKKVITPKFNNLIIFHIPSFNGIPHFVSYVLPKVRERRFAISGWFQ